MHSLERSLAAPCCTLPHLAAPCSRLQMLLQQPDSAFRSPRSGLSVKQDPAI